MSDRLPSQGSYLTPRLAHARVADAMRHGILSCAGDATVRDAARTMSSHHVHTIVITDPSDGSMSGMLTDKALLSALRESGGGERLLDEVADRDLPTIANTETLAAAAQLMHERDIAHLVVLDAHTGRPTGMLSTLDLAGILAWGEA
jgi:CBS domain-containing protein